MRVGSTVVRLDGDTEPELLRIDDDHLQLQLHRGASLLRLRDGELAQQFAPVNAEGRFHTDRPVNYRFDRIGRRIQAIALVGWVGRPPVYRPGVSIEISIGVGGRRIWYPLAPRDRHESTFRSNPRYELEWKRPLNSDRDRRRNRDERPSYSPPQAAPVTAPPHAAPATPAPAAVVAPAVVPVAVPAACADDRRGRCHEDARQPVDLADLRSGNQ